mgnify:CR=1 FL=1
MLTHDGRRTTDDARRTTHDDGRQSIAIGNLTDSGDLKSPLSSFENLMVNMNKLESPF